MGGERNRGDSVCEKCGYEMGDGVGVALGCQDVATMEKSTEVYRKANYSTKYAVTRLRALRRVTA